MPHDDSPAGPIGDLMIKTMVVLASSALLFSLAGAGLAPLYGVAIAIGASLSFLNGLFHGPADKR